MAVKVLYKRGLKETYLGLKERSANALYFCTDSKELYKGDDLYTDGLRIVDRYEALPVLTAAADGKLYLCEDTGNGYVLNATRDGWMPVFYGFDGETIGLNDNGLLSVKAVPMGSVSGLADELERIEKEVVAGGVKPGPEFELGEDGSLELKAVEISKITGLEERLTAIEQAAVGGVHYKGSVETVENLPKDAKQGDLYEVKEDNSEWCWNGEQWFEYGSAKTVDLKPVATADLNESQFEIEDGVLSIINLDTSKISHRGKSLMDLLDEMSRYITWEDMAVEVQSFDEVTSVLAQADEGDAVKMPSGVLTDGLTLTKSVKLTGASAGLAQNFAQEVK